MPGGPSRRSRVRVLPEVPGTVGRAEHSCRASQATNSGVLQSRKLFATIVGSTFAVESAAPEESAEDAQGGCSGPVARRR